VKGRANHVSDEASELLDAARTGAEWAIAVLYRELNPALLRYLRARAPLEAEDLAAEVWMALAARLSSFEGDEHDLRKLSFTIAHRRLVDHWRRTGRRRRREELTDPTALPEPGEPDTADITIDAHATAAALATVRRHLTPDQADVLLLRVVAGLSVDEVADVLGRRPGAVRVLQHRALKRLASLAVTGGVTR
jgi:RNA polymerase sigma-70 factor, ECF subfamily